MADAGFRVTVKGEAEFKNALQNINDVIKVHKSELKLLSEQYKVAEQPMEVLKEKQESLSNAMELQIEKSRMTAEEIERISAIYGKHDERVRNLVKTYNESETELARLKGEYNSTTEAISSAEDAMRMLAEMQANIDDSNVKFRQTIEDVNREIASTSSELNKSLKGYTDNKAQIDKLDKSYDELSKDIESQKKNIATLTDNLQKAERVYGENAKETEAYREQLNKATESLADMSAAAEENRNKVNDLTKDNGGFGDILDAIKNISGELGVNIPDELTNLLGGIGDVTKGFSGWGTALALTPIFKGIIEGIDAINEKIVESADKAKETINDANLMGVSTEQFQQIKYAASQVGVETDAVRDALNDLNEKVVEAKQSTENYYDELERIENDKLNKIKQLNEEYDKSRPKADDYDSLADLESAIEKHLNEYNHAMKDIKDDYEKSKQNLIKSVEESMAIFNELGVNIADDTGEIRPMIDVLYNIIDALNEYQNPAEKLFAANEAIGESSKEIIPFIELGSKKIKELSEHAKDIGIVIPEEQLDDLKEFNKYVDESAQKAEAADSAFSIFAYNIAHGDFSKALNALKEWSKYNELGILFGGGYTYQTPKYGFKKNAAGTPFSPGGWTLVGENGPEIVNLPRGSEVFPTGVIPRELASGGGGSTVNNFNISIPASNIREFNDIVRIVQGANMAMRRG